MNKAELIEAITEKTSLKKSETEKVLEAFIDVIKDNITQDKDVRLVGFGTFSSSLRRARAGRNPLTGEEINIPERKVPVFKPGKDLKESVNR